MNNLDLLKTSQTCFLPVFNYAVMIENQFGDVLMPATIGVYKVGDIYPSIIPGKQYYSQKINKFNQSVTIPIVDINKVSETVIDESGNVIIPKGMMLNKENYLRNEPSVPSRGLIIIELMIKRYIESISPWVKYSMYNNKIISNFKPEGVELFIDGHIDKICESLFTQVSNFIGNDVWFIYFVKYLGLDIIIEKTMDFRTHQWMQEHGHEYK